MHHNCMCMGTLPVVTVTLILCYGQAEQIMEAIELYKEEHLKLLEYEEECKVAGKKVKIYFYCCHTVAPLLIIDNCPSSIV